MKAITVEVDSKGKTSLIYGLETSPAEQSKHIKKLKSEGLPKGVKFVHMISLANGLRISAKKTKDQVAAEQKAKKEADELQAKNKKAQQEKEAKEAAKLGNVSLSESLKAMKKANQAKPQKEK